MTIEDKNNDAEKIRRVLKNLREVKTDEEFELRLKRRLTWEKKHKQFDFVGRYFNQHRVPVYAVSVVALIAIGIVSYYSFFRSGIVPTETVPLFKEDVRIDQEESYELRSDPAVEPEKVKRKKKIEQTPSAPVEHQIGNQSIRQETKSLMRVGKEQTKQKTELQIYQKGDVNAFADSIAKADSAKADSLK
ncbi:MAG: hypothetical protein QME25_09690 [Bacteroidota bacterium]|nr:hypothetical protein [Bacteroidota bacterium]